MSKLEEILMKNNKLQNNKANETPDILIPASILLVIHTIVQYLYELHKSHIFVSFGAIIVSDIIVQIIAYLTCYFFVIKRNKGQKGIWINYIIWILVFNIGIVSEMING